MKHGGDLLQGINTNTCTPIALCSMYNTSLCFNQGEHSSSHIPGVERSWADILVQAKNIFPDHQIIHSGSWSSVYWSSWGWPWRTRNLYPRYRIIEGIVNSSHKRVSSGATPVKGAAPAEVILFEIKHRNSSKLLTNSQFHLHRYSKTSSVTKQWTCSWRTLRLVMWCSGRCTTSRKATITVIYPCYIRQT